MTSVLWFLKNKNLQKRKNSDFTTYLKNLVRKYVKISFFLLFDVVLKSFYLLKKAFLKNHKAAPKLKVLFPQTTAALASGPK